MNTRLQTSLSIFLIGTFLLGCTPPTKSLLETPVESAKPTTSAAAQSAETEEVPSNDSIHNINPLTGLAVEDPSLLDLPAVLVSISHFPVTARPQAGLSFAPMVFEIYITEGATRFLTAFYGGFPATEKAVSGRCRVRNEPVIQTELLLGNRVWFDANKNDQFDDWENGIGGVCVNLYDKDLNLLEQTVTDSNGYYAFNATEGTYNVQFDLPDGLEFSQRNAGDADRDSEVDPATGYIEALTVSTTRLDLDAGLIPSENFQLPVSANPNQVGPVRSGRLIYADIANFFEGSCLIYAYASSEVLPELPKCSFVEHIIQGGGYMLDISQMVELANERRDTETRENYISNVFNSDAPENGKPATQLNVYIAYLHQSAWAYDAASQSYWRYVDNAEIGTPGELHPEIDRLNKRQLQFENVIVLYAEHDVISPTNLDIHLEQGRSGKALLFRDGMAYEIRWSVESNAPIQFQYEDGEPFPLRPGHTWITVVTPLTAVTEQKPGQWLLQFSQPKGAK